MKRFYKIVALVLAALMLLLSTVSCASSPTVLTIGTYDVSYDMLRYFVKNYMNGYTDITEQHFMVDPELQEQLEKNVMESLTELAAYYQLARKFSLKLDSDDKTAINTQVKELIASFDSKDEYEQALKDNFVTEDVLREIYELEILCDKLYDHLTMYSNEIVWDVEKIDADFVETFYAAEHLMIYYSSSDAEEKQSFANSVLSQMKNGTYTMKEIYDKYVTEYGVKIEYTEYKAFTYYEMQQDFEDSVKALEIGEYSEVKDLGSAYQIILRNDLDMEYYNDNYNTIEGQWLAREFFSYVQNYSRDLGVEWKKKYKDMKLWEME